MRKRKASDRRGYDIDLLARGARLAPRVEEPVPFCWMCDRTEGRRAREHIFPRWLLQELDAGDELFHPTHVGTLGQRISARGPVPASALVAGEVCEACNGGWMSTLEQLVRPILFPPAGRSILSVDDQPLLARWLIKTAVVLNTSQNYRLMIPQGARHPLRFGIPPDFGVHLASFEPTSGKLDFAQNGGVAMSVVPPEQLDAYNREASRAYACAIGIGGVLGVVVYAPPGGWAIPTDAMVPVWPTQGDVVWADLPRVDEIWSPIMLGGSHPDYSVEGVTRETWEAFAWRRPPK